MSTQHVTMPSELVWVYRHGDTQVNVYRTGIGSVYVEVCRLDDQMRPTPVASTECTPHSKTPMANSGS
jgi:hypothetical protein